MPTVFYKAFEDNSGAIELVRTSKMRPRTKHINLVYHNFREYVRHRNIIIHPYQYGRRGSGYVHQAVSSKSFS